MRCHNDEIGGCDFDPYEPGHGLDPTEESWHFKRTCTRCGYVWWGIHCPCDGRQNPCPGCDTLPTPTACPCDQDQGHETP